jgi:hypothetical protein
MEGNLKDWHDDKPVEENMKAFSWVPGLAYRPKREVQLREVLKDHPKADQVVAAIQEVHAWLNKGGCLKRNKPPIGLDYSGWATAYNLQPDTPFPERG